ncbi:MAG: M4 family metallopeptidase [Ignavibacteriales bacterium]|nr:M4 family metallopeptidase [Ignavibacteriales bacterium]
MKNIYKIILLVIFVFCGSIPISAGIKSKNRIVKFYSHDAKQGLNVLQTKINHKLEVEWNNQYSTPVFVGGRLTSSGYVVNSDKSIDGIKFLSENNELFGLKNPAHELKAISSFTDNLSITHIKYQQEINGVKIFHGQLIVHINPDGSVESVNGRYYPTPDINTTPLLNTLSAINIAKNKLGNYKSEKEFAELNIYDKNNTLVLVYEVSLPSYYNPNMQIFIDANTGEIIKIDDGLRYDGPQIGTGKGLNGQTKSINTYLWGGDYAMIDASLPMYKPPIDSFQSIGCIVSFDAKNDTAGNGYIKAVVIVDPNNDNNFSDNERLKAAIDAHIYSRKVYEFYKSHFNRNSFDNKGKSILNILHFKENYNNAFWNGVCLTYGDGDGVQYSNLAGAFDVITHEMTHAVTSSTADLVYENQPGAMNEAMSDAFGCLADSTNWLMGEDVYTPGIPGDGLRSMQDPHNGKAQGDYNDGWLPAHMNEFVNLPNDEQNDWGGVHINSGIPNKAFYNVASVIGHWKTGKIWYRGLTVYLTKNSRFSDLRTACTNSAKDLYGRGSVEYNTVVDAFDAVGITGGSSGNTVDLIYDDNNPDSWVYESAANWELAVRFSPPSHNSEVKKVSIYISGDYYQSGNGHFNLVMYKANPSTGLPTSILINPYSHTPAAVGWQNFDLSNVIAANDFLVGLQYDGINAPALGADLPPGNGKAYEFDPTSNSWYKLNSPNDYTLFIRASVATATGVVEIDSRIPEKFEVYQNYPNPFNPTTSIRYSLPQGKNVELFVYDISGKKVAELVNNFQNAGVYEVTWNGTDDSGNPAASGVYFYKIKMENFIQTNKMMFLK